MRGEGSGGGKLHGDREKKNRSDRSVNPRERTVTNKQGTITRKNRGGVRVGEERTQ